MKNYIPVIFLVILFVYSPSYSQTTDSAGPQFSGSFTFNGLYQSGNTNKFLVQGRGEIKRVNKNLETIILAEGSYGENKGSKDDNSYYASLTADFNYQKDFSPFLLQYLEYNYSKGIDFRSQSGGGLKYVFIENTFHKTSVSLAVIYDYLNLVAKPGNSESKEVRLSIRLKTRQDMFDKKMTLNFLAMFQPVVNQFSKSNFYINTKLEFPLTEAFKLNANYIYGFDNVVSVGRKRADNKLTFGMGIYF